MNGDELCIHAIRYNDAALLESSWSQRDKTYNYLSRAVRYDRFELAEWIIQRDPSCINRVTFHGGSWTPLMNCCSNEAVEFLLKRGADVTHRDIHKRTVLHVLCRYHPNVNILPLLALGLNELETDDDCESALYHAKESNHPQLDVLENYRKVIGLVRARETHKVGLSIDLIRALQPYVYST
jgi:hypothetical protein